MVMKTLLSIIFSLGAIVIICTSPGCESTSYSAQGLRVTGKVGEILVVCEEGIWNTEIKNQLDTGLTQFIMPYLPDVVTFELIHRTPNKFEHGIKRYRNVLFINIDPEFKGDHGTIELREDVWAETQLVIDINGKDFNQVLTTCKKGLDEIHEKFEAKDWGRIMGRFASLPNPRVDKLIKKTFGIKIDLPDGAVIVTERKNFYRVEFPASSRPIDFGEGGQDAGTIFSGVMLYQYDYIDSSQFAFKNLLNARDTMLKYNVPSEIEGMYMGTQYVDYVFPEGNDVQSADGKIDGYEMRGMFKFVGNGKFGTGGAFWAYHFVHPKKKKLICISGYVDAPPTTSWTHPLREVQAVLRSVELAP
ncbi:MAG: hypothetical protein ACI837_003596 [Crocinitomicaceae bacterium]|jgi:hypothetical protein